MVTACYSNTLCITPYTVLYCARMIWWLVCTVDLFAWQFCCQAHCEAYALQLKLLEPGRETTYGLVEPSPIKSKSQDEPRLPRHMTGFPGFEWRASTHLNRFRVWIAVGQATDFESVERLPSIVTCFRLPIIVNIASCYISIMVSFKMMFARPLGHLLKIRCACHCGLVRIQDLRKAEQTYTIILSHHQCILNHLKGFGSEHINVDILYTYAQTRGYCLTACDWDPAGLHFCRYTQGLDVKWAHSQQEWNKACKAKSLPLCNGKLQHAADFQTNIELTSQSALSGLGPFYPLQAESAPCTMCPISMHYSMACLSRLTLKTKEEHIMQLLALKNQIMGKSW